MGMFYQVWVRLALIVLMSAVMVADIISPVEFAPQTELLAAASLRGDLNMGLAQPAPSSLRLMSPRLGWLFTETETIDINVEGVTGEITWAVEEIDGPYRATNRLSVTADGTRVPITVPNRGLYRLTVTDGTQSAQTTFGYTYPMQPEAMADSVGMFFTDLPSQEVADNFKRMGVQWARLNFWFFQEDYAIAPPANLQDTSAGSVTFTRNRAMADRLAAAGIQVMGTIEGLPSHLTTDGGIRSGPRNIEEWRWLFKRTVLEFPEIQHWEIWNEPDANAFYTGTPQELTVMVNAAYDALRELDPQTNKKIVCCGFTSHVSESFLTSMFANGNVPRFDILSLHYTASNPWIVRIVRDVMTQNGLSADMPIWNTEEDDPDPAHNLAVGIERTFRFIYYHEGWPTAGTIASPDHQPTHYVLAMRTYAQMIAGATFGEYVNGVDAPLSVLRFVRPTGDNLFVVGQRDLTVYPDGARLTATVDPTATQIVVTDDYGREQIVPVQQGVVQLDIATMPYAEGIAEAIRPQYYVTGTSRFVPTSVSYTTSGHIMVEAERPEGSSTPGWNAAFSPGFSGNQILQLATPVRDVHAVELPVPIPADGEYDVIFFGEDLDRLFAIQPPLSAFRWRINDGPWQTVTSPPERDPVQNMIAREGAFLLGRVPLPAGTHALRLELIAPPGAADTFYFLRFDGVLFRNTNAQP